MLNYQGSGVVVASVLLHTNIFLIVVWNQGAVQPYVLARYENGSTERQSGLYFDDYPKVLDAFVEKLQVERKKIGPQ